MAYVMAQTFSTGAAIWTDVSWRGMSAIVALVARMRTSGPGHTMSRRPSPVRR
jgi:hypothetical protein